MTAATISGLWRHPVKGFTPEPVDAAVLEEDGFFPFDRLYALEVGPSGYDPEAPRFISKMRFAVLARFAAVARMRTRYDAAAQSLHVIGEDGQGFDFDLTAETGRAALARRVETVLAQYDEDYDPARFPLKVLAAPEAGFRFMDSSKGFVSLLNLNSCATLAAG